MLSNEDIIKTMTWEGYQGIYYSIFNDKTVSHYRASSCYGSFPVYWESETKNALAAGVIVWIQKDYVGADTFVKYVQSDEFYMRDTVKIEVIEALDKYGFVWRYDKTTPFLHVFTFMKMCRQWSEHRAGGSAFDLLVKNGMKPTLALYLCQYYRRNANNLILHTISQYHGAWAENTLGALYHVYHNICPKHEATLKLRSVPSYGGTDSWMRGTTEPRDYKNPKSLFKTDPVIGDQKRGIRIPQKNVKGTFCSIQILDITLPNFIKMFDDYFAPPKFNPEDEDI